MPTSNKVKKALMAHLLQIKTDPGLIVDLGSGWGTLVFALATRYPTQSLIGFETSPLPFWISRLWQKLGNWPNIVLKQENFYGADLRKASLVLCYLYPGCMHKLRPKLEAELPKGCWVVSHTFAIPKWQAEKVVRVNDLYQTNIYFYKI